MNSLLFFAAWAITIKSSIVSLIGETIDDFKENCYNKISGVDVMIKRELYMSKIRDFIDKPLIKVITGIRRSGKSMLLMMVMNELLERGISKENILNINFESLQYIHLKDYLTLYNEIKLKADKTNGKLYILLDEIQDVDGWEKAVNSFRVDFDCDIYVTGSNAKLLASELATHIAGRYIEIRIYPLSFAEYIEFAKTNNEEQNLTREQHFTNYIRFGGLPGIHLMKWEEPIINQYLTDIYNSVLLKDVISRSGIRDIALLESIVAFIMDNIGNTFSAKTVSDFLKSQGRKLSHETVYNYLKALENAFIIHKVQRFDIKGKRLLETQEKYFLDDLGLRHAVMGYRDNDIAGVLENVVYLELLRRGYTVNIGKQDAAEVDFIATRQDEKIYIQVCYVLANDNVTQREFGPLKVISDNYEKLVLSMDWLMSFNIDGIKQRNIIDFLLDVKK